MQQNLQNKDGLVKNVFNKVYDKYDLMNDLMSMGIHRIWKKSFIDWLNPQKNTKLIDVASGTGDIAKLFLNKVNYSSEVFCVDENKGMLNINKKKFEKIIESNGIVVWLKNCHLKIIILIIIQLVLVSEMFQI